MFGGRGSASGGWLAGDTDDLADGPGLAEHGEHVVGEVGAGDRPAAAHVPPHGGAVVAGERLAGELRRAPWLVAWWMVPSMPARRA